MNTLVKLLKDESGASAAEYALILAIVGGAIAVSAVALGGSVKNSMNKATNCIASDDQTTAGRTTACKNAADPA